MPLPVVGIGWLITAVSSAFGLGLVVSKDGWDAFKNIVNDWIVAEGLRLAGVQLDKNDPLSDASLANALSMRVGFTIRTLKDQAMIEEDLLEAASLKIEERTGVRFNNLRDPEQIKADATTWGVGRLAAETGIYLSNPLDVLAVKDDLMTWGKQQAMSRVASDLSAALGLQDGEGRRLVDLLAAMGHTDINPKSLMKQANVLLLSYAKEEFGRAAALGKVEKRRLQNRLHQRAFRKSHKKGSPGYNGTGVAVYVPVGWVYSMGPPPEPDPVGGG